MAGVGAGAATLVHHRHARQAAVATAKAKAAAKAKADREVKACQTALNPYLDSLLKIDSAWNGSGLNEQNLWDWSQNASFQSSKVNMVGTNPDCATIKRTADSALTKYNRVATSWNTCIYDDDWVTDCTDASSPVNFGPMDTADALVEKAREALEAGTGIAGSGANT